MFINMKDRYQPSKQAPRVYDGKIVRRRADLSVIFFNGFEFDLKERYIYDHIAEEHAKLHL